MQRLKQVLPCCRFIASEKRGENLSTELWLLTEFQEKGSLYDVLKATVLTWQQLCRVAHTIAQGLAFLHEEIPATATLVSHACDHKQNIIDFVGFDNKKNVCFK